MIIMMDEAMFVSALVKMRFYESYLNEPFRYLFLKKTPANTKNVQGGCLEGSAIINGTLHGRRKEDL